VSLDYELVSIADAQDRDGAVEEGFVGMRRGRGVDARRAPGEDHSGDLHPRKLFGRSVVPEERRIDAERPDPPADQVRVLTSEVEDRDAPVQEIFVQPRFPLSM
jgi:hypothetical protein